MRRWEHGGWWNDTRAWLGNQDNLWEYLPSLTYLLAHLRTQPFRLEVNIENEPNQSCERIINALISFPTQPWGIKEQRNDTSTRKRKQKQGKLTQTTNNDRYPPRKLQEKINNFYTTLQPHPTPHHPPQKYHALDPQNQQPDQHTRRNLLLPLSRRTRTAPKTAPEKNIQHRCRDCTCEHEH